LLAVSADNNMVVFDVEYQLLVKNRKRVVGFSKIRPYLRTYLVDHGIASAHVTGKGYGVTCLFPKGKRKKKGYRTYELNL
jgi:hypothetical protein